MRKQSLSVIIVSYNGRELLRACLNSLFKQSQFDKIQVILVDNASTDGTPETVTEEFPQVQVMANSENRGFAAGVNQGLAFTTGQYVCLLNQDVVLRQDTLDKLVEFLENHRDVAAVGPRLRLPNGRLQVGAGGQRPSPLSVFCHFMGLSRVVPSAPSLYAYLAEKPRGAIEVDWISGACLVARAEVFGTVGLFDDSFFMYSEDIEWGERVKQAGWRLCLLDTVEVIHHWGSDSPQPSSMWLNSLDIYLYRRLSALGRFLIYLSMTIGFLLRVLVCWLGHKFRDGDGEQRLRNLIANARFCFRMLRNTVVTHVPRRDTSLQL